MGCLVSKRKKKVLAVYNRVWDLLDGDGDEIVDRAEVAAIASVVHEYQVKQCAAELERLKARDPVEYVLSVVGKADRADSTLARKDFARLAPYLPFPTWHDEVLPLLRKKEIQRLVDLERGRS